MLVLSRRPKERVTFPELNIAVEVLEIKGDRVRLGFEAPDFVTILRGEIAGQQANAERPTPHSVAADTGSDRRQAPLHNRLRKRVELTI
jgi:carbon storage regulator CsrA